MNIEALRIMLKYFYTGTIALPSDVDLTLQILGLAHQYSFTNLETTITKKIQSLLNLENVCGVFNTANLYDLEKLLEVCHSFIDANVSEILGGDCFTDLSQVKPQ